MNDRRRMLKLGVLASAGMLASRFTFGSENQATVETQQGDPNGPTEEVSFSRQAIDDLVFAGGRAIFREKKPQLPAAILVVARSYVGYSRDTTPDQIGQYLTLFNLPYSNGGKYTAFCAAGISFCAAKAYADLLGFPYDKQHAAAAFQDLLDDIEHWYFYPSPSCIDMVKVADGKHRWVPYTKKIINSVKPGWIVVYNWKKDGYADHCGIVDGVGSSKLSTIEFNTSGRAGDSQRDGGVVATKQRDYDSSILGFIKTLRP